MRNPLVWLVAIALGSTLIACGGDDEEHELPEVDCDDGAVVEYEDVSAFDKCVSCHDSSKSGSARAGAVDGVDFDTEALARDWAELAAHEVYEGAMPPPDSRITLSEAEKEALYRWALCTD